MLCTYDTISGIEAFSTMRGEELPYPVLQPHQTHGTEIAVIEDPCMSREQLEGIDALITPLRNFAIGVRTADCIPVLLYDSDCNVVASVHAGWRGTVAGLVSKTVSRMTELYSVIPERVNAVIGPGIGPDSFQIGEDVVQAFSDAGFPMDEILSYRGDVVEKYQLPQGTAIIKDKSPMRGGYHLDLWKANELLLKNAGLKNVSVYGTCTYLRNDLFYSARREGLKCPRIITAIKIKI